MFTAALSFVVLSSAWLAPPPDPSSPSLLVGFAQAAEPKEFRAKPCRDPEVQRLIDDAVADPLHMFPKLSEARLRAGTDPQALGQIAFWTGGVHLAGGAFASAISHLSEAAEHFQASGDAWMLGWAQAMRGMGMRAVGQLQSALVDYEQALAQFQVAGDSLSHGTTLDEIGLVLFDLGRSAEALLRHEEALKLIQSAGDEVRAMTTMGQIGLTLTKLGRRDEALVMLEQVVQIGGAQHDPTNDVVNDEIIFGDALTNVGFLLIDLARPQEALEHFQEALEVYRSVVHRTGEGNSLMGIGLALDRLGRHPEALDHHEKALAVAREVGARQSEGIRLHNIGLVLDHLGRPHEALARYEEALVIQEELLASLSGDAASTTAVADAQAVNRDVFAALALDLGQTRKAYSVWSTGRTRALLDRMGSSAAPYEDVLTQEELSERAALTDGLTQVEMAITLATSLGEPVTDAMREDRQTAETRLRLFITQMETRYPELRRRSGRIAASALDILAGKPADDVLAALAPGQAVVEFANLTYESGGESKPRWVAFVFSAGEVRVVELGTGEEFGAVLGEFARHSAQSRGPSRGIQSSPVGVPQEAMGPRAFELLWSKLVPALQGVESLVLIPDGLLWSVPFHALPTPNGTVLWDQYEIAYAASGNSWIMAQEMAREGGEGQGALILANPDYGTADRFGNLALGYDRLTDYSWLAPLPGTQQEADALAGLLPGAVVLGAGHATETAFREQAPGMRFLHLATHGLAQGGPAAMMSSLVLSTSPSDDGFLTAREIFELELSAEVAVLSACDTGQGDDASSEGLRGLAWAFFCAGVPATVVSQWPVSDLVTAELMVLFYQNMLDGMGKAEALRAACLDLRARHPEPHYWAPFIMVGAG